MSFSQQQKGGIFFTMVRLGVGCQLEANESQQTGHFPFPREKGSEKGSEKSVAGVCRKPDLTQRSGFKSGCCQSAAALESCANSVNSSNWADVLEKELGGGGGA